MEGHLAGCSWMQRDPTCGPVQWAFYCTSEGRLLVQEGPHKVWPGMAGNNSSTPGLGPGRSAPQGFVCTCSSCHSLVSWTPGLGALRVPQCLPSLQCLKTEYFFCLMPIQFRGPDIPADHETESIILHLAFLFFCPQYKWKCITILYF